MNQYSEEIERYLLNQMDAEERTAFEKKIETDQNLKQELNVQKSIMDGIENIGIKQSFSKAINQHLLFRNTVIAGVVVVLLGLAVSAAYYFGGVSVNTPVIDSIQVSQVNSIETTTNNQEKFSIDTRFDTIIETNDGIVIAIPANGFNGDAEHVELSFTSFINPLDILKAGLSTESNGKLLQTAGMFDISAKANGKTLEFKKPIEMVLPTDSFDAQMLLFKGEKDSSGNINWVDSKPISKALQTTPMEQLNFYPPKYLSTLKELKLEHENKQYRDSLYYSFSGYKSTQKSMVTEAPTLNRIEKPFFSQEIHFKSDAWTSTLEIGGKRLKFEFKNSADHSKYLDSVFKQRAKERKYTNSKKNKQNQDSAAAYEIDPSRIKAFWNNKFNNTILASKAFEERMQFIFTTCKSRFLNNYTTHLDWPLYAIDSLCASTSAGSEKAKFLEFYKRRDGGVEISKKVNRKLSKYLEDKTQAYMRAAAKTWEKYRKEEAAIQAETDKVLRAQAYIDMVRTNNNYQEEFCINLVEANRQLGKTCTCPYTKPAPAPAYYRVSVMAPGSYNLDKYVGDATRNRSSLTYLEPDGKKAVITYSPLDVFVKNYTSYDRVLPYLIPNGLSSFQRMQNGIQANGSIRTQLNDLLVYDLVVLAFKGDSMFFARKSSIKKGSLEIQLLAFNEAELKNELNIYTFKKQDDFNLELSFVKFENKYLKRRRKELKIEQDRTRIARAIFPCYEFLYLNITTIIKKEK